MFTKIMNVFLRRAWTGRFGATPCSHLDMIGEVEAQSDVCDQCVALGSTWPALRMCLTCGHVGCCEKAEHQHALNHYRETGHPLVVPHLEPSMHWIWCYEDQALIDRP